MHDGFPGGSKARVNKAGRRIALGETSPDDERVLEEWRTAHRAVINTFQALLRKKTRGTDTVVVQRHKRKVTIIDKLQRLPRMNLARMDDVAGCRLIFSDLTSLAEFRASFHLARFNHELRHDPEKYDYISHPKSTGYRGIHDVYEYNVRSPTNAHLRGLLIELQYRTRVQHAWATASEVIGRVTGSHSKFERGDDRHRLALMYAGEILARAHEGLPGPIPELSNNELVDRFDEVDREIHLIPTLRGLKVVSTVAQQKFEEGKNAILIFRNDGVLDVESYSQVPRALRRYFEMESRHPELDIVLVHADSIADLKEGYANYFSDVTDFLMLLKSGRVELQDRNDHFSEVRSDES